MQITPAISTGGTSTLFVSIEVKPIAPGRKFSELSEFGGSEKEKFVSVWNISSALAFQSAGLVFYA
jgi:hypothetical protein